MLTAFACDNGTLHRLAEPSGDAMRSAVWIDLVGPTADEVRSVESATGLEVSSRDELSEIETSSRLAAENGELYLSMPLIGRGDEAVVPVGFVLSSDRLLTIRFADNAVFEHFADRKPGLAPACLTACRIRWHGRGIGPPLQSQTPACNRAGSVAIQSKMRRSEPSA